MTKTVWPSKSKILPDPLQKKKFVDPCLRVQRQQLGPSWLRTGWPFWEHSLHRNFSVPCHFNFRILSHQSTHSGPLLKILQKNAILPRNGPRCFHLEPLHNPRLFLKSTLLWGCWTWVKRWKSESEFLFPSVITSDLGHRVLNPFLLKMGEQWHLLSGSTFW